MARPVNVPILKDGRVCYHYFVRGEGKQVSPKKVLQPASPLGPITAGGSVGHIACNPTATVGPAVGADGVINMRFSFITDDPRAATCPKCMATEEFAEAMAVFDIQQSSQDVGTKELEADQISFFEAGERWLKEQAAAGNRQAAEAAGKYGKVLQELKQIYAQR